MPYGQTEMGKMKEYFFYYYRCVGIHYVKHTRE